MEVAGAAIAINITYILTFILGELYVRWIAYEKSFKPMIVPFFHKSTFDLKGWWIFLEYGTPSTLLQCFEWWAFEVLAIFSGWLGTDSLSAQVAVINVIALIFMVPFGIQMSASSLVGNKIG